MEQTKADLRRLARNLAGNAHGELMRLGEVLRAIRGGQFHYEWGWDTWADYVENEVGLTAGITYELMAIARWSSDQRLLKAQREALARLGRCKAAILARMGPRRESADYWLRWARGHTVSELRARAYGESMETAPKTVAFWMDGRQRRVLIRAMNRAKREVGEEYHGELLATICQGYLAKIKAARKAG